VYSWNGSSWSQVARTPVLGGIGYHVRLNASGNTLAVGAPQAFAYDTTNRGRVYVYSVSSNALTIRGSVLSDDTLGYYFGRSIDLSDDGNSVAVTASAGLMSGYNPGQRLSRSRVYFWSGSDWVAGGEDIIGEASDLTATDDLYHFDINSIGLSRDGSVLAIGTPFGDGNATDSGVVRIYGYAG
jgi:hypothetical protein